MPGRPGPPNRTQPYSMKHAFERAQQRSETLAHFDGVASCRHLATQHGHLATVRHDMQLHCIHLYI